MAGVYHTEPPTSGKVLMRTSFGDVDIELWPKEAPKACRNFVQLCLEGYYDGTIFHRILKGMLVQGGDPTGAGTGGESIYGAAFRDEIHSRIRFNHRGQVAMANSNQPHTNGSQFFFTLNKAEHLNNKHTIFGKITGNTIFNALRMGDVDVDNDDRPLEPVRLVGMEVLNNPFDNVVPRPTLAEKREATANEAKVTEDLERAKRKKRTKRKDFKLLSFGEEAEEEETRMEGTSGIQSAHDLLTDDKLSKQSTYKGEIQPQSIPEEDSGSSLSRKRKTGMSESSKVLNPPPLAPPEHTATARESEEDTNQSRSFLVQSIKDHLRSDTGNDLEQQRKDKIKRKAGEYQALREELRSNYRASRVATGSQRAQEDPKEAHHELLTPLQQMRFKYKRQKAKGRDREAETLRKLQSFTNKVKSENESSNNKSKSREAYHGQILESGVLYEGDESDSDCEWMRGQIHFKKHLDDAYRRVAADGRDSNDYIVIDPKNR